MIIELVGGFIYRWGLWSWKMGKAYPNYSSFQLGCVLIPSYVEASTVAFFVEALDDMPNDVQEG